MSPLAEGAVYAPPNPIHRRKTERKPPYPPLLGSWLVALLTVLLTTAGCTVQPLTAQELPDLPPLGTEPVIAVAPTIGAFGEPVTVAGAGWRPEEIVYVNLEGAQGTLQVQNTVAVTTTDAAGRFVTEFTMPLEIFWQEMADLRIVAHSEATGQIAAAPFAVGTATPAPLPVAPTATPSPQPPPATPTPPAPAPGTRIATCDKPRPQCTQRPERCVPNPGHGPARHLPRRPRPGQHRLLALRGNSQSHARLGRPRLHGFPRQRAGRQCAWPACLHADAAPAASAYRQLRRLAGRVLRQRRPRRRAGCSALRPGHSTSIGATRPRCQASPPRISRCAGAAPSTSPPAPIASTPTTSDGIRLVVDGQPILNAWQRRGRRLRGRSVAGRRHP